MRSGEDIGEASKEVRRGVACRGACPKDEVSTWRGLGEGEGEEIEEEIPLGR